MQESNHNAWRCTFRKYACPKLKLSRLLLDNLFRILEQNLPALEELNSKKHTPSPIVWFLRNCGIEQNLSFAKTVKGNFARNDFCEWLRKLLFFFAQRKKNFAFCSAKIAQQFCEWKPYMYLSFKRQILFYQEFDFYLYAQEILYVVVSTCLK